MPNIKPIRPERDYEAALHRISELMDAEADSPEGEELDVLVDLVELYESKQVPIGYPGPIAAIEFRLEQAGLRPADLASFIGSSAIVPRPAWEASAVRDRPATMAVMNLANALQVHPAIVAGRVRFERKNYRLLSQFVGTGEVWPQFGMVS